MRDSPSGENQPDFSEEFYREHAGQYAQVFNDPAYGVDRTFQLYDEQELLEALESYGLNLVEAEDPNQLGGIMYFTDPKPMEHCVFYVRKEK